MLRLIGEDGLFKGKVHGRLIALEISNPSPALEKLVDKYIKPQRMLLAEIIRELAGEEAETETIKLCTLSIIGQCFHYAFANPIIEMLGIVDMKDMSFMERAIDHIYDFSIGGIYRIKEGVKQS
jgi:TetR/AcrR family transcriptional regulator, regulator of cefoperazone and chloramphenicol sensitivity